MGLFGSCGDLTNLNCTSPGLLQRFDKLKIRQRDIDEFMTTWSVPRNESQFRDVLAIAKENRYHHSSWHVPVLFAQCAHYTIICERVSWKFCHYSILS